jgi:hypothetical protein
MDTVSEGGSSTSDPELAPGPGPEATASVRSPALWSEGRHGLEGVPRATQVCPWIESGEGKGKIWCRHGSPKGS